MITYPTPASKVRVSAKNRYISDIVWELDHFKNELIRSKDSKEFRPVWYHGDQFTRFAATRRIEELESELLHIETDSTYKPWKEVDNA